VQKDKQINKEKAQSVTTNKQTYKRCQQSKKGKVSVNMKKTKEKCKQQQQTNEGKVPMYFKIKKERYQQMSKQSKERCHQSKEGGKQ